MAASDAELNQWIEQLAQGERQGLKALYEELRTPVFRYAMSIVRNYQTAEDVAQDTFLNLIQSAGSYQKGSRARAWIFTIVRNLSMDALKKESRSTEWEDVDKAESFHDSVDSSLDAMQVLARLEPLEREIVSMYLYGGLRQTEIAKVLKLPYIQVRAKYGYAIKKLRRFLERSVHSDG